MRVATDPAYPPHSYLEDGKLVGFDIDVAKAIAKRLDVEVEFVTPAWDAILSGDWADRWDISVGSMTPTRERRRKLDFPAIYCFVPAMLVVHVDNTKIQKVGDASGSRIGVAGLSTYQDYLESNLVIDMEPAPKIEYLLKDCQIVTYDGELPAFEDLRLGDGVRLDGLITALPLVLVAMQMEFPVRFIEPPLFHEPLAIAVEQNQKAWSDAVSEAVSALSDSGELSVISERWHGRDLTVNPYTPEGK